MTTFTVNTHHAYLNNKIVWGTERSVYESVG